jgi:hypothetical protein
VTIPLHSWKERRVIIGGAKFRSRKERRYVGQHRTQFYLSARPTR